MEAALAQRGFEVWSVDLREQGKSRRDGGSTRYRLEDLALHDVASAVHGVRKHTRTRAEPGGSARLQPRRNDDVRARSCDEQGPRGWTDGEHGRPRAVG